MPARFMGQAMQRYSHGCALAACQYVLKWLDSCPAYARSLRFRFLGARHGRLVRVDPDPLFRIYIRKLRRHAFPPCYRSRRAKKRFGFAADQEANRQAVRFSGGETSGERMGSPLVPPSALMLQH
jgi:hypothetical protein